MPCIVHLGDIPAHLGAAGSVLQIKAHLSKGRILQALPSIYGCQLLERCGIVALRDRVAPETLILANGDVGSLEEARARAREYGLDGVMVGRGLFGNPWFFCEDLGGQAPSVREKLQRMVEHTELFERLYKSDLVRPARGAAGERPLKNFDVMKKHFKAYCSGFDDAKELRIKLMATENAAQVRAVVERFLAQTISAAAVV